MSETHKNVNKNEFFLWGPFLYKTTITEEQRLKLLSQGKELKTDYRHTLAGKIDKELGFDDAKRVEWEKELLPIVNEYLTNLIIDFQNRNPEETKMLNDCSVSLQSLWINYQQKGEYNPIHDHSGDISFVIYLNVPGELGLEKAKHNGPPNGSISWEYGSRSSLYPRFFNSTTKIRDFLQPTCMVTTMPLDGEIYMFPSYLRHYVQSFETEGVERISVSGNFTLEERQQQ